MTFYMVDERSSQISVIHCAWVPPTIFSGHYSIIISDWVIMIPIVLKIAYNYTLKPHWQ